MEDSPRVKRYHRTHRILSVIGYLLDLAYLLVLLFSGWSIAIRSLAEHFSRNPGLGLLVYLLIFGLIAKLISLPLEYLGGFWLEHRYEVSNLSFGGWIKDELKGIAVGGVLGVLAVELVYFTLRRWPSQWWLISAALFVGFFVLMANLAPILILPIFFKFKPIENQALRDRLLELARRARTRVNGIFEWKLSEKTKKANAALVGLGNTRRMILSDTLLGNFSEEEVEAVLAHEFGHHVHHHLAQLLVTQTAATFLGFYLLKLALERLGPHFGFRGPADYANFPLVILVGTVLSFILLPAANAYSRALERQADAYALRAIASRAAFISSMEKLSQLNLAERKPHPWIEFIFHSHPSIEKRIAFAEEFL